MASETVGPNIYIIGAQCTGKTTLVAGLEAHFTKRHSEPSAPTARPPAIISEVARSVLKEHVLSAADVRSPERSLALQRLILQAQAEAERRAVQDGAAWFIADRSGVDPIVYAERYVGQGAAQTLVDSAEWSELKERMAAAIVVVCQPSLHWLTDDGVRAMPDDPEDWMRFHDMFCSFLGRVGLPYMVLPSALQPLDDRVQFVLSAWEETRKRSRS
jgi:nicotinamide riboside kinase